MPPPAQEDHQTGQIRNELRPRIWRGDGRLFHPPGGHLDHPIDAGSLRALHQLGHAHSVEAWRRRTGRRSLRGGDRGFLRRRVHVLPRDRRLQSSADGPGRTPRNVATNYWIPNS